MILGDYAFPRREDTMYLDTVQPRDVPLGKTRFLKEEDNSLKTADIFRATPHYYWNALTRMEKPPPGRICILVPPLVVPRFVMSTRKMVEKPGLLVGLFTMAIVQIFLS